MNASNSSHETTVSALESLRTADRILMAVEGDLRYIKTQQGFDALGGNASYDGILGGSQRAEVASASSRVLEAQQELRSALKHLGIDAETAEPVSLERWGVAETVFGAVFDILAYGKAHRNLKRVLELRVNVRELFDSVRSSDVLMTQLVSPLAEEEDEKGGFRALLVRLIGVDPEFWTAMHWYRAIGWVVFAVGGIGLLIYVLVSQ